MIGAWKCILAAVLWKYNLPTNHPTNREAAQRSNTSNKLKKELVMRATTQLWPSVVRDLVRMRGMRDWNFSYKDATASRKLQQFFYLTFLHEFIWLPKEEDHVKCQTCSRHHDVWWRGNGSSIEMLQLLKQWFLPEFPHLFIYLFIHSFIYLYIF